MDLIEATKKAVGPYLNSFLGHSLKRGSGNGDSGAAVKLEKEVAQQVKTITVGEMQKMAKTGNVFTRLAGLSGAAAVMLGAYGAHAFAKKDGVPNEMKQVFETANKYHFLHSIVLLAVPLTRRPMLTGCLLGLGTLVFSGTCYYYALTEEQWVRKYTPYGGFLLIFGWLSMAI